jgi:hypothetical protein
MILGVARAVFQRIRKRREPIVEVKRRLPDGG